MDCCFVGNGRSRARISVVVGLTARNILKLACAALISLALLGCDGTGARVDVSMRRASGFLRAGKMPQAKAEIDAAIAFDPSRAATYCRAARLYASRAKCRDAVRLEEQLIRRARASKLNPKLSDEELAWLYVETAGLYNDLQDFPRTQQAYKDALAILPDNPVLLNDLGWFYADKGIELEEALKLTKRAAALAPNNGLVVDSLGWAQVQDRRLCCFHSNPQKSCKAFPRYRRTALSPRRGLCKMQTESRSRP